MIKRLTKAIFIIFIKQFSICDIEVDQILTSKRESYSKESLSKYFLGCNDDVIRSLRIKLHQMIRYVKQFDSNKTMSFKVNDNRLLKRYPKIWGKVSNLMNIEYMNILSSNTFTRV